MKHGNTILRCIALLLSLAGLGLAIASILRRGEGFCLPAALVCCGAGLGIMLWTNRRDADEKRK